MPDYMDVSEAACDEKDDTGQIDDYLGTAGWDVDPGYLPQDIDARRRKDFGVGYFPKEFHLRWAAQMESNYQSRSSLYMALFTNVDKYAKQLSDDGEYHLFSHLYRLATGERNIYFGCHNGITFEQDTTAPGSISNNVPYYFDLYKYLSVGTLSIFTQPDFTSPLDVLMLSNLTDDILLRWLWFVSNFNNGYSSRGGDGKAWNYELILPPVELPTGELTLTSLETDRAVDRILEPELTEITAALEVIRL